MKLHELFEAKERSILSVMGKQPEHIDGDFYCSNLKLTSLKGSPSTIDGRFRCSNNKLTSLEGSPSKVGDDFYCEVNKLSTLEGAPSYIGDLFYCYNNNLTSLHNIHKQIKYIGGIAIFEKNPITSHVLGLLMIERLENIRIDNQVVQGILNKHLEGDRDVFACQEELIEAGFEDFAKL